VTSSSLSYPYLGVSYTISFDVEGIGEGGPRDGGFDASTSGTINCFGISGSGECSALLEFGVLGITQLRKSERVFVRVYRLISALEIFVGSLCRIQVGVIQPKTIFGIHLLGQVPELLLISDFFNATR